MAEAETLSRVHYSSRAEKGEGAGCKPLSENCLNRRSGSNLLSSGSKYETTTCWPSFSFPRPITQQLPFSARGQTHKHVDDPKPLLSFHIHTMSSEWSKRQAGVGLVHFNATDIWSAPGDPINSTAAFHHATHLENQAYVANRWLFTAIMIVLLIFMLLQVPHTFLRLQASPSIWYNFRFLRPTPAEIAEKKQVGYSAPPHRTLGRVGGPPKRLRHIQWPIPIYHVRGFDLPLSEFLVVLIIWAAGLGVAGWCQASFLTDASRSTLVVMFFMTFTAGLGIKAGGIGTWLAYGYTAVNFLHRWTGRLVLLLSTLHVIAYLVVFYKDGGVSDFPFARWTSS